MKAGTKIASWDELKKLKIGVQASTTAEFYLTSGEVPGWKIDGVSSFPVLISTYGALDAGTIGFDALLVQASAEEHVALAAQAQVGGPLLVDLPLVLHKQRLALDTRRERLAFVLGGLRHALQGHIALFIALAPFQVPADGQAVFVIQQARVVACLGGTGFAVVADRAPRPACHAGIVARPRFVARISEMHPDRGAKARKIQRVAKSAVTATRKSRGSDGRNRRGAQTPR